MDVLDEVLAKQQRVNPRSGKIGFNASDGVRARKLLAAGADAEEIAYACKIRLSVVEKFVESELTKPDPSDEEPVVKVSKKKAKKEENDDQD